MALWKLKNLCCQRTSNACVTFYSIFVLQALWQLKNLVVKRASNACVSIFVLQLCIPNLKKWMKMTIYYYQDFSFKNKWSIRDTPSTRNAYTKKSTACLLTATTVRQKHTCIVITSPNICAGNKLLTDTYYIAHSILLRANQRCSGEFCEVCEKTTYYGSQKWPAFDKVY